LFTGRKSLTVDGTTTGILQKDEAKKKRKEEKESPEVRLKK